MEIVKKYSVTFENVLKSLNNSHLSQFQLSPFCILAWKK